MATQPESGHAFIEKNVTWLIVLVILVVSVGGLVEIVPLFFLRSTASIWISRAIWYRSRTCRLIPGWRLPPRMQR